MDDADAHSSNRKMWLNTAQVLQTAFGLIVQLHFRTQIPGLYGKTKTYGIFLGVAFSQIFIPQLWCRYPTHVIPFSHSFSLCFNPLVLLPALQESTGCPSTPPTWSLSTSKARLNGPSK